MYENYVINEIFTAFAKLQLWFHLSHYYRLPGFFNGVFEIFEAFGDNNFDAAHNIIVERVLTDPEELREIERMHVEQDMPETYEGDMDDWVEECSQVSDLFFCVAVYLFAHLAPCEDADCLVETLDDLAETESERAHFLAVMSTILDLRTDPDTLAG